MLLHTWSLARQDSHQIVEVQELRSRFLQQQLHHRSVNNMIPIEVSLCVHKRTQLYIPTG